MAAALAPVSVCVTWATQALSVALMMMFVDIRVRA